MVQGFALIKDEHAHEHETYIELSKVKDIIEIHQLFGEYYPISRREAEDYDTWLHSCKQD
jgi:hypothetical protein